MKRYPFFVVALALTFVLQTLLGIVSRGSGFLDPLVLLPWVLVPPLKKMDPRFFYLSFLIGLGWDLCFEPIIGPGIIAWSMTAGIIWWLLSKLSGRDLWIWAVLASASTILVWLVRALSLRILGLPSGTSSMEILSSALATGIFCWFVGILFKMDIPSRYHRIRKRKLR